ncbi:MAG: DUF3793 family protein [Ruminococcus flavefaciens]|nr:DUF3793 family protein [Ruminococcus flavefaciens]
MSKTEYKNFSQKLALHTAPTLLGIKCASLVSLSTSEFDICSHINTFNSRAYRKNLKIIKLYDYEERSLLLIYNEKLMQKRLSDCAVKSLLSYFGYSEDFSAEEYLNRLGVRISENETFPHEIGVFLDYPIEDVIGFMENKGGNYKLCGYWKVYGNEEKARRTFNNYVRCRNFLCNKLNQGVDLYQALKIY